jgi:methyl coenzyme M reductase subunit C-like uncharacterized protein (methanogenesis marker protein 7)
MGANKIQIGGEHYKSSGLQHWDIVDRYDVGYFEGNISKYVTRWRKKNGVQDLKKASHYLQKLIESRSGGWADYSERQPRVPHEVITHFIDDNQLGATEAAILHQVLHWRSIEDLTSVAVKLQELIDFDEFGGPTAGYVNQDR